MLFTDVIFAATGYWKVWVAILEVCRRLGNRRLHYAWFRFVSRQNICFFTALALSPSLSFRFILFSMKTISTWFPQKWRMLVLSLCSGNASLTLNCPRIWSWDYRKCNTETNTTAARGCNTYTPMHHQNKTPEVGTLQTGKQTNRKTCLEIFMI